MRRIGLVVVLLAVLLSTGAPALTTAAASAADVELQLDLERVDPRLLDRPERFALPFPADVSAQTGGEWTTEGTEAVWRYVISVAGAVGVAFHADRIALPAGGALLAYGEGPLTHAYGPDDLARGFVWGDFVQGGRLTIEARMPAERRPEFDIHIAEVHGAYRDWIASPPLIPRPVFPQSEESVRAKAACQVTNYECVDGPSNDRAARAIGRVVVANQFSCTGTLLNNGNGEDRYYFLTAEHCQDSGPSDASTLRIYWDESTPCGQTLGEATGPLRSDGANHRAEVQDAWLVELLGPPPLAANAYLAGYDATDDFPTGIFSVHHAMALDKQFFSDGRPTKETVNLQPGNTIVEAWISDPFNDGASGPGSSGGGYFDTSQRLIGLNSGAFGDCDIAANRLAAVFSTLSPHLGSLEVVDGRDASTPPDPQITLFEADPTQIRSGQQTTLTWETSFAPSCAASGGWSGSKPADGSENVTLTNSSNVQNQVTFTLSCTNASGSDVASVNVTVLPPLPTVTLTVSPATIVKYESATLNWSSTGAQSCQASGDWSGSKGTSGSESTGEQLTPGSKTYTLTCTSGFGETAMVSRTLTVNPLPAPAVDLTPSPSTVVRTESSTLTWTTMHAEDCTASGDWAGSKPANGSESTGALNTTGLKTFTLTCENRDGVSSSDSAMVDVLDLPPPIVNLSVSPSGVLRTESAQIQWSTTYAQSCTASGDWGGSRPTQGSESTGPQNVTGTRTYTLTCTNADNESSFDTDTLSVQSIPAPTINLLASPSGIRAGEASTLSWSTEHAGSCVASGDWSGSRALDGSQSTGALDRGTYSYTLDCQNLDGVHRTRTVTVDVKAQPPTVDIETSSGTVGRNGQIPLSWETTSAESCTASGDWSGSKPVQGSQTVTASRLGTLTYTLTCLNAEEESAADSVMVESLNLDPPVVNLAVDPGTIEIGFEAQLEWTTTNAASCTASGDWSGSRPTAGAAFTGTVTEPGTYTYVLTCQSGAGVASGVSVDLLVELPDPPAVTFTGSSESVPVGSTVTLEWNATGSDVACEASGDWDGAIGNSGDSEQELGEARTYVFTLTCSNPGGSVEEMFTVVVFVPDSGGGSLPPGLLMVLTLLMLLRRESVRGE